MAFVNADAKKLIQNEMSDQDSVFGNLGLVQHPCLAEDALEWHKWRKAYAGGKCLLENEEFLVRYSKREKQADYERRRKTTPVFTVAKTAINNIRNAIFQRMHAVSRLGGSTAYSESMKGENGGVDRRGTSANVFFGKTILTDLILMGRAGIYVDSPQDLGGTLLDSMTRKPYLYYYPIEDIRYWVYNTEPGHPSEFSSLLLRDTRLSYESKYFLPVSQTLRYRWVRLENDKVVTTYFDKDSTELETIESDLERIPFVLLDTGTQGSVMRDVLQHQIAILNLDSTNMNFALLNNFPRWVERRSSYGDSPHLKKAANADGTATTGGQAANEEIIEFGDVQGRTYAEEAPRYVSPPAENLVANQNLREKYENDVYKMAHQAIADLAQSTDNPFESGLAYLGNLLEGCENKVARFWAEYETSGNPRPDQIAKVEYPERWNLKSDKERLEEASKLAEMIYAVPGREIKKQLAKSIASALYGGKLSNDKLEEMLRGIDDANYTTSDPQVLKIAHELGVVGNKTTSIAFGFDDDEYEKAQEDRAERIALTRAAQAPGGLQNPAARGVPEEAVLPATEAAEEKEESRVTDEEDEPEVPVRGEGQ